MAAMSANPNPSRITGAIWDLWTWFDQLEPTVSLGGIFAAKGGYHDIRAGHGGDYSVAEVSTDREGPNDKASALDLTMSAAAMRKYTTRLDVAAKARDERLYIGGQAILREFIGTKDSSYVYCYVLVGGRARGLPADASEDWSRDSTHIWHLHLSIIRKFCASQEAADRIYSVLSGESLAAWKARRSPSVPQPQEEGEEEIMYHPLPLPHGFGYAPDADGEGFTVADPESIIALPFPPAGLGKYQGKSIFLSFFGNHADADDAPDLYIAINNGGWSERTVRVPSGKRVSVAVPATTDPQAFGVSIGRINRGNADHADLPIGLLVEIV